MSVAVIADAHLGGPGGGAESLVTQLEGLPGAGCDRLVLLGDLFHVWVGFPQFETPEVAAVLPALKRLRGRGVRVDYVEGNRDFFIVDGPYRGAFDRLAPELSFSEGGVRYLAVHGDGLDDGDRNYRMWRWLSKSAPSRWMMRRLPPRLALWLVRSTERRLAATNFRHKISIPEQVIRLYAARRLTEGHDVLLLGHFHRRRSWAVEGGRVRLVEAWFATRTVVWLGGEKEERARTLDEGW